MKKLFICVLLFGISAVALAQNPGYQQKLYYTCKVWGYVKYFHSRVSGNQVNWDKALLNVLPLIKNAETNDEFNDALDTLLKATGNMYLATKPLPDTLPAELKRNLNFEWFNNPIFRKEVKAQLDTIKNNFRPHENSWVKDNTEGTGYGWLAFPSDDPIFNINISKNFPDEFSRLLIMFKYWNIMNYFNPNNYILDTPWDSTLYHNIIPIATATDYKSFMQCIEKISTNLNDAHVEGLTSSSAIPRPAFSLKLVIRYMEGDYVVVKSGYSTIAKGDIIVSINGKTTAQLEDSLRPYVSSGNPAVFRRYLCQTIFSGNNAEAVQLEWKDSLGNVKSQMLYKYTAINNNWFSYFPTDSLSTIEWKKWDCDVAYVHIGNLKETTLDAMYSEIKNTKAIIFDVRTYPKENAIWSLADLMYPTKIWFSKFTMPDVTYPGTYYWFNDSLGISGNTDYYKGKVIILCNQETQSAAEYCCMALQAMPGSIVVGSQTAGADGNITAFKISQDISAGFTTLGVYYPDGTQTQRTGIVPDSVVCPTADGIRHGRDEVLEKALSIAGCAVSVNEKETLVGDLAISPNPASDFITITMKPSEGFKPSEGSELSIYNTLGEKVMLVETLHATSLQINISSLPKGMYFVKYGTETKKFVVIR